MSGRKETVAFLTAPSYDAPMILNVSHDHECQRIELTEGQLYRWQILIAEYLMIRAQRNRVV